MALYRILHRHNVSAGPTCDLAFTSEGLDSSPAYKIATASSSSLSLWKATPKAIEHAAESALSMSFTEVARKDDAHGGLVIVGVESLGRPGEVVRRDAARGERHRRGAMR